VPTQLTASEWGLLRRAFEIQQNLKALPGGRFAWGGATAADQADTLAILQWESTLVSLARLALLSPEGAAAVTTAYAVNEMTGILSRFGQKLMSAVGMEEAGAVELAIALMQAFSGQIPVMFKNAVKKTIVKMLTDRTQLEIARTVVERSLRGKGWVRAEAEYQEHQVEARMLPGLSQENQSRYGRHKADIRGLQSKLDKALLTRELALEYAVQDERLNESIPKLEKAIRIMRENQNQLLMSGHYEQQGWAAARKEAFRLTYGRVSNKPNAQRGTRQAGGIVSRTQHLAIKCHRTAMKAVTITQRNLSRAMRIGGRAISGKAPSIADVIFGYQAAVWLLDKAMTPTRQSVTYTERERGADTIELKSVNTEPKPMGERRGERRQYKNVGVGDQRHWEQVIGGVEDEDSGVDGAPNQISDPIADKATEILNKQPGMDEFK